jgi:hypothetical protein
LSVVRKGLAEMSDSDLRTDGLDEDEGRVMDLACDVFNAYA